jgi:hypothetical protein
MIKIPPGKKPGIYPVIGFIIYQLCERSLEKAKKKPDKIKEGPMIFF